MSAVAYSDEHVATHYADLGDRTLREYLHDWSSRRAKRELQEELHRIREADLPTSTRHIIGRELFDLLNAAAILEGAPLDALRRNSPVESERFWARTIPGPDGHLYWIGGKHFYRNQDARPRSIKPPRWVWVTAHGSIPTTDSVTPKCGDVACIALDHLECNRRDSLVQATPLDRLIGRLQVVAMRLGHTPTTAEWERLGERPLFGTLSARFGSWAKACEAAGLEPTRQGGPELYTAEALAAAVKACADHLGRIPFRSEYEAYARPRHLPSRGVIFKRFGSFRAALVAAGLDPPPARHIATAQDVVDAILELHADLGRTPSRLEYLAYAGEHGKPSYKAIQRTHRNYRGALRAAGLC